MSLSIFTAAADAPDHPAVITDDVALTYRDLARRVRARVQALRSRSLDRGMPVAVVAATDLPTFETVHALISVGSPALLLHPRLTARERDALVGAAGDVPWLRPEALEAAHAAAETTRAANDTPASPPDDDRPLAIVHTSGTSGTPRGVVLSRRAFVASARASAANLGWLPDDRWLLPLPLAHVGGLSILTRCLLARRTVVLVPGTEPRALIGAITRHRVTLVSLVPTLLRRILDLDRSMRPPPHLRAVLLGGAAAAPELLERAADRGWPVLTTYGLTEACSQITTQPYGTVNRGEAGSGPALPGTELRIGDDEAILARGPTLFNGYLGEGPPPLIDGGWFETGDRGHLDADGNLHVLGRRTDRIVTGGENVDPVEVEQALERLPWIREACVFGIPDPEWGEVVCAAVVTEAARPDEGARVVLEQATHELRGTLAPFKLPRRLALVPSLPKNRTGKLDRAETARRATEHLLPTRSSRD